MTVATRRIASLVSAVALLASGTAGAQVTIHVTTTSQATCDITTDAAGLRLAAGGTDLVATGATLSGSGCGGAGGGAPTPNNFSLNATPAAPTAGVAFSVSWTVTGATTCTGSASLNGSSTTLSGWTDSTSATSPRSVTATSAGNYTLSLTCSNSFGSVTSAPATVTVGAGSGDVCPVTPRTRATVSDLHYLPEPPAHVRRNVDLTSWDEIWGHITENDDRIPFPGPSGASPTISSIGKTQYIAAKFNSGSLPANVFGFYKNVSYGPGPNLDMAISTSCGDFAPAEPGCSVSNVQATDQGMVYWRMVNGTNFYCPLLQNTDYFLNIQFHDINTTGPGCSGTNCRTTIQHYHQ
jgi:hypothetical protein